jgi:hypothetical protein
MKLGLALRALHHAETELAEDYGRVAERHAAEHDVHHLCRSLAKQCESHAERLRPAVARYADDPGDAESGRGLTDVLDLLRRRASELVGRQPPAGLLLLRDLRELFLSAEGCSITWVMVGQAAQAARDDELLELVRACHEETELQVKWLVTRIKEAAPQALVTA